MAKVDLGGVAERLFVDFMAPLVLGGDVTPGRPIGARAALALGDDRVPADADRLAHVQLGRVRVARRLVPVDRLAPPTGAEWALAAALHDAIQATHPSLGAPLRRSAPRKLLDLAEATADRTEPPRSAGEALARHTWFARALDLRRTDTSVSWWVGKSTFLGAPPPARLTAWPELRRVHVATTERALLDLPTHGADLDPTRFAAVLGRWLAKTPLTDVATCTRAAPAFTWSGTSLALVASRAGRTLALRAVAASGASDAAIDAALGRATRRLFTHGQGASAAPALAMHGERLLTELQAGRADAVTARDASDDALFARAAGSVAARRWLDRHGAELADAERRHLLTALEAIRASTRAVDVPALVARR